MATMIMSMATRSSDLKDWMSGTNPQTESHTDGSSQGQKNPKEMGALGISPSHLPSWSLARRPPPSHPNTRYCLGTHVTLTEEIGAVPPPCHTWTLPLVDYMLHYARTGLTKLWLWAQVGQSFSMGNVLWVRA